MVPLFGAAYAAPNKGTTILYWFRSPKTQLNPPVNGKIQGLFKAFESAFQVLFKTHLIFKDFSRQSCIFKYFSSLCEPCKHMFKPSSNYFLLTVPMWCFFCGSFLLFTFHVCLYYAVLSIPCSFVITCCERADLLALVCVMFSHVFVTFPYGVSGLVWYSIVYIPDLCLLYFELAWYTFHTVQFDMQHEQWPLWKKWVWVGCECIHGFYLQTILLLILQNWQFLKTVEFWNLATLQDVRVWASSYFLLSSWTTFQFDTHDDFLNSPKLFTQGLALFTKSFVFSK